ncbi:MAG: hypothetical protein LBI84_07310 [Propionibacteriaceae bacterium]|nr:hypothetical protein [Propionibacteriaceae bacterium]
MDANPQPGASPRTDSGTEPMNPTTITALKGAEAIAGRRAAAPPYGSFAELLAALDSGESA